MNYRSRLDVTNEAVEVAALARINELEALVSILVRELRYIEGISSGQVQRVAKQALEKLPDNAMYPAKPAE